jgi:hypothetical protein
MIATRTFASRNEYNAAIACSTRGLLKALRRRSSSSVMVPISSATLAMM